MVNSAQLEALIRNLGKYIEEYKAKLVIVDSIISLHRAEYTGRDTLAERQQRLNVILHKLLRLAEVYNIAVVLTNQVQVSPDNTFGGSDSIRAAGAILWDMLVHTEFSSEKWDGIGWLLWLIPHITHTASRIHNK